MKRKLLSILLACLMVLGMMPVVAFADDMTITLGSVAEAVAPGDSFTMTATMANNTGFTNEEWIIDFDTDVFEITDITGKKMLLAGAIVNVGNYSYNDKKLGFITWATAEAETENDDLFSATFRVKADAPSGEYTISIINHNFKNNGVACVATFVPGTVTVEAPASPVDTTVDGNDATSDVNSVDTTGSIPEIDAKANENGVKKNTVNIPEEIAELLKESGKSVRVRTDVAEILFDEDAADTVFGGSGAVALSVEEATLDGYAGAFQITATAGGNSVFTGSGNGKATIKLSGVSAPTQGKHYALYYIPDSGEPELIRGAVYDEEEQTLTFKLGHFSTYAYKEDNDADYSVILSAASATAAIGEEVGVAVKVASDTETAYNAIDMTFSYDSARLTLVTDAIEGYTVDTGTAGKIRVYGYGADKTTNSEGTTAFTLAFTAADDGEAVVGIDAAYVDKSAHAISGDAPEANYGENAAVTVSGCAVTINETVSPWFTYEAIAVENASYTFSAKNLYYTYAFTATMGGVSANVTDNGDGTFTIANVTGPIEITSAERTGKYYTVTKSGSGADDITLTDENASTSGHQAQYANDYTFTLDKDSGYSYDVDITIGGTNYSGYAVSSGTYTIDGDDITGAIVVDVEKTAGQYSVTFEGTAAGDFTGNSTATAGTAYTFTLTKATGYAYTAVTATIGGGAYTLAAPSAEGSVYTYTIPGSAIDGNIVIRADKSLDVSVKVNSYVTLDGQAMYLVLVSGTPDTGKAFTYAGNTMFLTGAYDFDGDSNADTCYAYLVITADTFTSETAAANISVATAAATVVDYGKDVNMSGKVDINDAQLVYDMYNAEYSDFSTVLMEKFLRADVNASMNLSVEDAAAVVSAIE